MIIGIDVSTVAYGTGVSNYTLNLVRNLIRIDRKNQYKLFFSSLRQPLPTEIRLLTKFPNVKIYHSHLPPTLLEFLWNGIHLIPIEFFIGKCDIFHTSDWTQPPTIKAKTIATIHDLTPFLFPEWHHPKVIAAHRRKMNLAVKNCLSFICVSRNTREDLLKLFPSIKQPIYIIPEAAEDKYEQFLKLSQGSREQKLNVIKKLYDLNYYVLAQGTREPRKNLKNVIKAFIAFKEKYPSSKVELAISGKYGWGNDVDHLSKPYIKILGYTPEKNMVALHASAICLIYPSLYEGFGLPLVKSMKVGVPVITANTSSMPEVIGNAGLLVNPESVSDISRALEKILKNSKLRNSLSKKSLIQSKLFSWKNTAVETLKVYLSLC